MKSWQKGRPCIFDVGLSQKESFHLAKFSRRERHIITRVFQECAAGHTGPYLMKPPPLGDDLGEVFQYWATEEEGLSLSVTAKNSAMTAQEILRAAVRHHLLHVGGYSIPGM